MRLRPARARSATAPASSPSAASRQVVEKLGERLAARGRRARCGVAKTAPAPRRRAACRRGRRATVESLSGERARVLDLGDAARPRRRTDGRRRKRRASARRAIERDERGEARAPVGEALEQPRLFLRRRPRPRRGRMARARVGERQAGPGRAARPRRRRRRGARAFLTVATTASGARWSTPCARRARSVASRGSHRERNRRIVKSQFLVDCPGYAIPDG